MTVEDHKTPIASDKFRFVDAVEKFYLAGQGEQGGMELNAPMAYIYKLCDGKRTVGEILEIITGCYDTEPEQVLRHNVTTAIEQMVVRNIICLV